MFDDQEDIGEVKWFNFLAKPLQDGEHYIKVLQQEQNDPSEESSPE